eukprot:3233931-Rhodomonas_salina.1
MHEHRKKKPRDAQKKGRTCEKILQDCREESVFGLIASEQLVPQLSCPQAIKTGSLRSRQWSKQKETRNRRKRKRSETQGGLWQRQRPASCPSP